MIANDRRMQATRRTAFAFFALQLCLAVFAQDEKNSQPLGTLVQPSPTSATAPDGRTAGTSAASSGKADGTGNPWLGGERRPLYRLHRSDVVSLTFTLSPEFDQSLTVQPDGLVFLKDAGPLMAQGLTLVEFRMAVFKAYAGYLHDPQVTVALREFEHPFFVAGGEVGHPGKYELRTETSIMEAVQIAGGFTHEARHSQVILFRRADDDRVEARLFNLKRMLKERSLSEAPSVRPGDIVFVPQNSISKIERFLSRPSMSMYISPTQF
jgi:polysaccharide export outer membrane protein